MLPRRKPPKSGIERAPQRVWPRHEAFVRRRVCIAAKADPDGCSGRIECCHVRSAANSGTGIKPPSWSTVSACSAHHALQHQIGQPAFEARFGIDLAREARDLARATTDKAMRNAMGEAEATPSESPVSPGGAL